MMKAFASVEGISRVLDPEFDMVAYAEPYIKKIKLARYSPQRIAGDVLSTASDFARLFRVFPGEFIEIVKLIKNEKLFVNFEMKGLDIMLKTHDQISNRLSFAIVIGAMIMGSAMILSSGIPPLFYGVSLIGIIGFSAAAILGIWLLIAILKKGKL
jgi:ubiquinone biosynthesis protein